MTDNNDDEWEYEYDEADTQDFYISIDLSNVPDAQILPNTKRKPGHPTLIKSRLRALHAAHGIAPEMSHDETNSQELTMAAGEVQVTGLHTANPLLMYNGQLLSCHWTATVGTDMFFTKPCASDSGLTQPLRSLPSIDLLSLGTAKLIAKVGRLRPHDDLFSGDNEMGLARKDVSIAASGTDISMSPSQAASNEQNNICAGRADFLARLNEAKTRRGETNYLVAAQNPEGTRLMTRDSCTTSFPREKYPSQSTDDIMMDGT